MDKSAIRFLLLTLVNVWFVASTGSLYAGFIPRFVSDQQLAKSPFIVVAKWEKVPWTELPNNSKPFVAKTKLRILRTVKGPTIDGEVIDLKLGRVITWDADGRFLSSATSANLPGDVDDITVPCLWFLDRAKVLDPNSEDHELSIDHYREVQPIDLESYYLALGTENAERDIPQLLTPDNPVLAKRVLHFIVGGQPVWPRSKSTKQFFRGPLEEGKVLKAEAARVWGIVGSDAQELRPLAVSVYASLNGIDGDQNLRSLLSDQNSHLRGTALGILTNHRDMMSLSQSEKAIQGIEDGYLLCAIIKEISAWGNDQNVPALISCLQSGGSKRFYEDTLVPALQARKVLHEITGCWFPLNVSKSLDAWRIVEEENVKEKRYSTLAMHLGEKEFPLLAELVGQPSHSSEKSGDGTVLVKIQILNTSTHELWITRNPCEVRTNYPGASLSIGTEVEDDFVEIAPQGRHVIQVSISPSFLNADPLKRKLEISFYCPDGKIGKNQWVGTLLVHPSKS